MRIVQVLENLDAGGLERMALDLAVEQKAAGHEAAVYCLLEPGALAVEAKRAGIPVTAFHKSPGFSPKLILEMAGHLRAGKADVVHTHNPGVHHYGTIAARLAGVPVVVNTRHGPATSQGQLYQERYFRAVLPLTDAVVCVSEASRRFLMEQRGLPSGKSRVILNGIRLERFLAAPAAPGSLLPRIRLGAVGRLVPVKGHAVLVDAFAQIASALPEAELRIVGGGPLESVLTAQIERLGLRGRVRLEGFHAGVEEVFRELDILVFSSTSEGLPLVILEAMAAGLPIVSTRVGGVPEVAPEGEVAWYCAPGDATALGEAILAAARCGELSHKGERARRIAEANYGVAAMYRQYEELYREAWNRRRPGAAAATGALRK